MTAAVARGAGWDASNWPAWNWHRGNTQMAQVWTSTYERCAAAGVALPDAPTWWRPMRGNLVICKEAITGALPRFVNAAAAGTNGLFEYSELDAAERVPRWTVTGVLAAARMPTNYFAYTPWRRLNGWGPFTNDPTVGHPHGETNATTAAGGTNFPPGRSVWYTSDYGWGNWTNLAALLDWTVSGTMGATNGQEMTNDAAYVTEATWEDALAGLAGIWDDTNQWAPSAGSIEIGAYGVLSSNAPDPDEYTATPQTWGGIRWNVTAFKWTCPTAAVEIARTVDLYGEFTNTPTPPTHWYYDFLGSFPNGSTWYWLEQFGSATGTVASGSMWEANPGEAPLPAPDYSDLEKGWIQLFQGWTPEGSYNAVPVVKWAFQFGD